MGTTLHPFRYLALARYILQRFLDTPTLTTFRGRAKAAADGFHSSYRSAGSGHVYGYGLGIPRSASFAAAAAAQSTLPSSLTNSNCNNDKGVEEDLTSDDRLAHSDGRQLDSMEDKETIIINSKSSPNPSRSTLATSSAQDLPPRPDRSPDPRYPPENREIYRLMNHPCLFVPGSFKPPREVVVLCHGLYGFSTATPIPLFPSLKLHYWASVLEVLRDRMGVKVVVVGVKGTGSIKERAEQMHIFLKDFLPRGVGVNFVAHSMGGLDCRHLISTIRPTEYKPLSLTTIATPHRGSPFMDWCAANIGVGTPGASALTAATATAHKTKGLPFTLKSPLLTRPEGTGKTASDTFSGLTSALSDYLLNIFDSPAYSNLTTDFLRDKFNPSTPDDPEVKYLSVAGRVSKMSVLHPLWFPKLVLDTAAEKGYPAGEMTGAYEGNDGLVNVSSAKWGEFLGVVDGCHHWELRGEGGLWPNGATTSGKVVAEGKPDPSKSDGWDWQGGFGETLGLTFENLVGFGGGGSSSKGSSGMNDSQTDPKKRGRDWETSNEIMKSSLHAKVTAMIPGSSPSKSSSPSSTSTSSTPLSSSSSSWDLAQVGQLIDWVADLFPGDSKSSTDRETRQMTDAKREKEKADGRTSDGNENGGIGKDGEKVEIKGKRGKDGKDKGKFDLAKFYGGLMLKLREDGL